MRVTYLSLLNKNVIIMDQNRYTCIRRTICICVNLVVWGEIPVHDFRQPTPNLNSQTAHQHSYPSLRTALPWLMLAAHTEGKALCVISTLCGLNIFHAKISSEFLEWKLYFCYVPEASNYLYVSIDPGNYLVPNTHCENDSTPYSRYDMRGIFQTL